MIYQRPTIANTSSKAEVGPDHGVSSQRPAPSVQPNSTLHSRLISSKLNRSFRTCAPRSSRVDEGATERLLSIVRGATTLSIAEQVAAASSLRRTLTSDGAHSGETPAWVAQLTAEATELAKTKLSLPSAAIRLLAVPITEVTAIKIVGAVSENCHQTLLRQIMVDLRAAGFGTLLFNRASDELFNILSTPQSSLVPVAKNLLTILLSEHPKNSDKVEIALAPFINCDTHIHESIWRELELTAKESPHLLTAYEALTLSTDSERALMACLKLTEAHSIISRVPGSEPSERRNTLTFRLPRIIQDCAERINWRSPGQFQDFWTKIEKYSLDLDLTLNKSETARPLSQVQRNNLYLLNSKISTLREFGKNGFETSTASLKSGALIKGIELEMRDGLLLSDFGAKFISGKIPPSPAPNGSTLSKKAPILAARLAVYQHSPARLTASVLGTITSWLKPGRDQIRT